MGGNASIVEELKPNLSMLFLIASGLLKDLRDLVQAFFSLQRMHGMYICFLPGTLLQTPSADWPQILLPFKLLIVVRSFRHVTSFLWVSQNNPCFKIKNCYHLLTPLYPKKEMSTGLPPKFSILEASWLLSPQTSAIELPSPTQLLCREVPV